MNAIRIFTAFCLCGSVASGAELVTDETTRLKVLAAVFPGMSITAMPGKRIDDSGRWPMREVTFEFPDALKGEVVYSVAGLPRTQNEKCASNNHRIEMASLTGDRQNNFSSSQTSVGLPSGDPNSSLSTFPLGESDPSSKPMWHCPADLSSNKKHLKEFGR